MANRPGTSGVDFLYGTAGDDIFRGFAGDDYLSGDAGNDIFQVASFEGFDNVSGGTGTDKIVALNNNMYIGLSSFDPSNSVEIVTANGYYGVTIKNALYSTLDFSATTLVV